MFGNTPCGRCKGTLKEAFSFCPYCGLDLRDPQKDMEQFGLLGKDDMNVQAPAVGGGSLGFGDKMFSSLITQLMKSLDAQMRAQQGDEVQHLPNGVTIKIGPAVQQPKVKKRSISPDQLKRMTGLPRVEAKTDVRRLSDKVLYELKTNGVSSVNDVFVSKVESGYEIKAIGEKKVYVNTLSVDLPLKAYALTEKGVTFEFGLQ